VNDRPTFVGELLDGQARDLFKADAQPVKLAGGQPRQAQEAARRSIVRVHRDADGWRVKDVLAERGSPLAKMYGVAADHMLDPMFPPAVEQEVSELMADPGIDAPDLEDLRHLPFVTIDGPGTRDLDQALHIARDGDGWLVRYALADPSWYVKPGTALFDEALRRGATFYLPGLAIPMLPRQLSEGIVSLNENVDRRAMVFVMRVGKQGKCERTDIVRARVRSYAQLTFQQVQDFIDNGTALPAREAEPSISLLADVGRVRMEDAAERNVIHYRRSETEVKLETQPPMSFVIELGMRSDVERYNEQLSLMCNVEGARFLRHHHDTELVQPIYRVHPQPSAERLGELEDLLAALASRHELTGDRWTWSTGGDLGQFLRRLPKDGREGRIANAIHRQAVLTNVRSTFSEAPGRHYGVGADVYARFSAPMREIVGVFVHKEAFEKLGAKAVHEDDLALRSQIVKRANEVKALQKTITKQANLLVLDELFEADRQRRRDDRPWRRGTVMGLTRGKAHVMLDDPSIELKVYTRHLEKQYGCHIDLSKDGVQLETTNGKSICCIGDEISVRVYERDKGNRWVLSIDEGAEG